MSAAPGTRWFAFLRAINTGGRRLTNPQLVEPFLELGFADVDAYQAAGNVTFRCDDASAVTEGRIEVALADAYGFATPTFVRSAAEIADIVARPPFPPELVAATAGKVQVTFMRRAPDATTVAEMMALVPTEDAVVVSGREWYWLPVAGVSGSTLPVGAVERLVGEMTMRTLGTLSRMVARFD
jgi:uncharacterized protein (DUF1697 family)